MNAPDRDTQLARRIYRLPTSYKTIILQLLAKCEDLRSKDCIERHLKNANNIIYSCTDDSGYRKLPNVQTKYCFIDKRDNARLTISQMARRFNKSDKTIYYWIYKKHQFLFNNYEVVRE